VKLTPEQRALYATTSGDMDGYSRDEADLFFDTCERVGLDPYSRQIYPMLREDKKNGTRRVTAGVTIDGFRVIASRSGQYRGQLGPFWCGPDGDWKDVWLGDKPPAAAKVGVMHAQFNEPLWAVARFDDYAQRKYGGELVMMWVKMGPTMVAKCAEALALRRAFPELLSGLYTTDEMQQASNPTEQAERPAFDPGQTKAAKQSPIEQVKAAAAAKGIELGKPEPAKVETYTPEQAKALMSYLADKAIELDEIAACLAEVHGINPATLGGELSSWSYSLHPKVREVIKDILDTRKAASRPAPETEPTGEQLDFANEE